MEVAVNSDKINRWLTLGANLGVLIGIVLILAELSQNADLMLAQMTQARGDSVVQTYRELMNSDGWLAVRAKRRAASSTREWVESLTPVEYELAWYRQLIDYHDLRTQYFQYKSGYLDPQIWDTSGRSQAIRFMETQPYFPFELTHADRDFYEYLNDVARESGLSTVELPD